MTDRKVDGEDLNARSFSVSSARFARPQPGPVVRHPRSFVRPPRPKGWLEQPRPSSISECREVHPFDLQRKKYTSIKSIYTFAGRRNEGVNYIGRLIDRGSGGNDDCCSILFGEKKGENKVHRRIYTNREIRRIRGCDLSSC